MAEATTSFSNLMFSISKPGWGTSTLVLSRVSPTAYELRLKRIEGGVSTADEVRDYGAHAAASLEQWIRTLGFYDQREPIQTIPHAGLWSLEIEPEPQTSAQPDAQSTAQNAQPVKLGGTNYPDAFPDLLTTFIGLGLLGLQGVNTQAFLSDFCTPVQPQTGQPAPYVPEGFDAEEFKNVLEQIEKDPSQAESLLRTQFAQIPASVKQQMLEFVRQNDPQHYEWWRRILLG